MLSLRASLTAVLFLLSSAAAEDWQLEFDFRIVNGTDADEGEFPFAVSLRYNNNHLCGGSILNEYHILTAAHCVCSNSEPTWYAPAVTVQYGLLQITSTSLQSVGLSDVICNTYDSSNWHIFDVAILRLSSPIPAEFLEPVILEDRQNTTLDNLDGVVVGWGRNATGGYLPDILQKVEVYVYNDTICAEGFAGNLDLFHHVCSGWPDNGRGSCQGDSGGPLLVEKGKVQIGIVSFGASGNCGISNLTYPKVLARVPSYIDFIQEYAGEVQLASDYFDDGEGSGEDDDDDNGGNDDDDDNGGNDDDDDDNGENDDDDDEDDDNGGNDDDDDDHDDDDDDDDDEEDDDDDDDNGSSSTSACLPLTLFISIAVLHLARN